MDSRKSFRSAKEEKSQGSENTGVAVPAMSLVEFLAEAQLSHYHNALRNELKVTCVEHLKYVKEEDLEGIGMTKPEMRRLKKFYKKEHPQGTFGKLKKAIMRGGDTAGRSLSPSPPEHRISRPISAVVRPTGKQLISLESISINKTLGEGEFGVVQQGVWTTENGEKVQVAIKRLSKERMQNGMQEFLKEAAIMQSVDHENIVRMYGVVLDKENAIMLVTELAPMRSLTECLKEPSLRLDFPVPRLCDFAQQVCDGMSYLESKRLIHRDLAARNILVFSKSKVKISDLGLSRALGVGKDYYQSNFSVHLKLPIAWCAPECINFLKFTSASDIWSYGVTLWEFFTYGFQPWAGLNGQQILEAIDQPSSQRLEQPDLCPKEYYAIMLKCWEHDPERRPTFSQLFITLPQIRPVQVKAVKDYPGATAEKDFLLYKNYDVIIVLDKNPKNAPVSGVWKGCLSNGKCGFFYPQHTVPYVEPKSSPVSLPKTSLSRKESGRKSSRKLRVDMIGAPQNDLRHTGHIGYDGAVFGDLSFIGDNYDKLPVKVGNAGKIDVSRGSSLSSLPHASDSPDLNGFVKSSTSDDSLNRRGTNGYGHSWISQESLTSTQTEEQSEGYFDVDDTSIFADFKMPDLSSSFDLGPSFMDEVLRALDEKEKQTVASRTPTSNGDNIDPDVDHIDMGDRTPVADVTKQMFADERKRLSDYSGEKEARQDSPPPLPMQPPRMETQREKKQAKVKPMSASEEKMMQDAINLANEVANTRTQRLSQSQSPPQSPTGSFDTSDHMFESSPSLITKLKNSIRRSPKSGRKRTFSDDLPGKGDMEDDLPAEAQEAYNALVLRGVGKDSTVEDQSNLENVSVSSDAVFVGDSLEVQPSEHVLLTVGQSVSLPSQTGDSPASTPPRPMPKPRIGSDPKKSEIPVPKPRPEIQRVEPIRRPPDSPDLSPKEEKKESHIPLSTLRKESVTEAREREREQLKKTIEVVRMDSPTRDEQTASHPGSREDSQQRETPEKESESAKLPSSSAMQDLNKVSSLFEDDFSEPSPREVMSKLARESRMRRNLDHQRVLTGESGDVQATTVARARREPQGIPGKTASIISAGSEEGEKDEDEVDTNPLRMLRGGAIPIRAGRGAPGTHLPTKSPSLRYPKLNFSSGISRSISTKDSSVMLETETAPRLPPRGHRSSEVVDSLNNTRLVAEGVTASNSPPCLPPRTPLRQLSMPSLNSRPRERRHPLVCNKDTISEPATVSITSTATTSVFTSHITSFTTTTPSTRSSFNSSSSCPSSRVSRAFFRSNSLHDEPCPSDLPIAPSRPRPNPISIPSHSGRKLSGAPSNAAEHEYCGVDESKVDSDNDSVFFPSSPRALSGPRSPTACIPVSFTLQLPQCAKRPSSMSRGQFSLQTVQCSLEQLGFFNHKDPFWVQTVRLPYLPERTHSDGTTQSSDEVSPLLLVNYKNSENVSYEDLLDFGLDRQKNDEEVDTLYKILDNEVSIEECRKVLDETNWDLGQAVKYIRLKQLLSLRLADVHTCKRALMSNSWDVNRAADYLLHLTQPHLQEPSSPESLEV